MKCVARVVSCVVAGVLAAVVPSQAQTLTQVPPDTSKIYVEFTGGPSFGHRTSGSVGGEVGYHIQGPWAVFFEGGHIAKAGTSDLDARANLVGNAVGAVADASYSVSYFDAGVRYNAPVTLSSLKMLHPYLMFGIGAAPVTAKTTLSVNGAQVPPDSLGVQFGSDLSGSLTKTFLTFGGGVNYPFAQRYFIDGSLRFGHVFAKTGDIENDQGINTLRMQFGVGVKF